MVAILVQKLSLAYVNILVMNINKRKLFKILIVIMMTIITLFISALLYRNNAVLYPYSVDADYVYDLSHTSIVKKSLNLKNGEFTMPQGKLGQSSDFVKININSTFKGSFSQPKIEFTVNDSNFTQYFEHGAHGVRYLNISTKIPNKEEVAIKIKGKNVSFDDQIIELLQFEDQHLGERKVLVIAPHPDDAEIAAYGLYSDAKDPYVITITAGDAGDYKYDEIYQSHSKDSSQTKQQIEAHYFQKGKLRTWNSITVPLLGGVDKSHTINLGFFDSTLPEMFTNKNKPVKSLFTKTTDINMFRKQNISELSSGLTGDSSWNALVENLSYLLSTIKPDIIVTPYPALDTHEDHKLASVAVFEAIKQSNIKNGALFLYSNHFVTSEYFPFGKKNGAISLPPLFDKIYFESIYSHHLTPALQKDKLFALEAMHDLRPDTEWRFLRGSLKQVIKVFVKRLFDIDNSYFKRAVRSNELFFVVNTNSIYNDEVYKALTKTMN